MIGVKRILRYFSGFHTDHIGQIMRDHKPESEQHIIETLKKIEIKKQYAESSPITESFVGKIEYFLLAKKQNLTGRTLHIYQMLKQLDILTPRFKYGILKILEKSMKRIIDDNLSIKNNELEVLLWFLYREYPLLRQTKFQQIASDHSLKLYQVFQFMNTAKIVPTWSPFLRISTMLQALGHEIECRKDMTVPELDVLDYTYYPFITNIFKTHQDCIDFRQKHEIYQPFLIYLCNKYIDRDKFRYDKYLEYVQRIDNEQTEEQVEKTIDPLNWYNFVELFQLYTKACEYTQIDTRLSYNVGDLFWRLCESKNVELQSSIRLIQIIADNPYIIDENIEKILMRVRDSIETYQAHYFKFLPGRGLLVGISSVDKLQRVSDIFKEDLKSIFVRNIPETFMWEQGEKEELYRYLEENKIEMKPNVRKFLENRQ